MSPALPSVAAYQDHDVRFPWGQRFKRLRQHTNVDVRHLTDMAIRHHGVRYSSEEPYASRMQDAFCGGSKDPSVKNILSCMQDAHDPDVADLVISAIAHRIVKRIPTVYRYRQDDPALERLVQEGRTRDLPEDHEDYKDRPQVLCDLLYKAAIKIPIGSIIEKGNLLSTRHDGMIGMYFSSLMEKTPDVKNYITCIPGEVLARHWTWGESRGHDMNPVDAAFIIHATNMSVDDVKIMTGQKTRFIS